MQDYPDGLLESIRQHVADAIETRAVLNLQLVAERIARRFGDVEFDAIVETLLFAAADAQIAVMLPGAKADGC